MLVVFLCAVFLWVTLAYGVHFIIKIAMGTPETDEEIVLPPAVGFSILLITLIAPIFTGFIVALASPNRPFSHAVALIGCYFVFSFIFVKRSVEQRAEEERSPNLYPSIASLFISCGIALGCWMCMKLTS